MLKDFRDYAVKFRAQHGRPAVLVFDNINVVAKKSPSLLYDLQALAKQAADAGIYKVVFVCSDGVAPPLLEGKLLSVIGGGYNR